nr:uncharacterized protein LOC119178485 [Rhipicephalus microplus]
MANATKRALVRTSTFLLLLAHALGEVSHRFDDNVLDTFDILRFFDRGVAIYDVDGDGDLDCVTAVRTEFIEEPLGATYVLLFKGLGGNQPRNITIHATPGPTPETDRFKIDDDYDFVQEGQFYYTNYKNCVVMEHPYEGVRECLLWTMTKTFHDIPDDCMTVYKNTCKDAMKPYDKESCSEIFH